MEKTLIIIKPDGVKRKLVGKIIKMIEDKGYNIEEMKMKRLSEEELSIHYEAHKDKEFYPTLLNYMGSGKSIVMVVSGVNCIQGMRKLIGSTDPLEAELGSIRGQYGNNMTQNIIHGSDSIESSNKEIGLFFNGYK